MSESVIPNPSSPIMFFLIITLIYAFLTIYNIYSQNSLTSVHENANNTIYNLIYIIILLIGTFFINLNISVAFCDGTTTDINWYSVFFITLLPWLIIFGLLYFILELFKGWVRPFSNTLGYMVINFLGAEELIKKLFKKKQDTSNESTLANAISKIHNDQEKFINEIDIDIGDYTGFVNKLRDEKFFDTSKVSASSNLNENVDIIELYKLLNIKHLIGKLVWYFLAGILITSISYNYIINLPCEMTLEETQNLYNKIHEQNDDSDD